MPSVELQSQQEIEQQFTDLITPLPGFMPDSEDYRGRELLSSVVSFVQDNKFKIGAVIILVRGLQK